MLTIFLFSFFLFQVRTQTCELHQRRCGCVMLTFDVFAMQTGAQSCRTSTCSRTRLFLTWAVVPASSPCLRRRQVQPDFPPIPRRSHVFVCLIIFLSLSLLLCEGWGQTRVRNRVQVTGASPALNICCVLIRAPLFLFFSVVVFCFCFFCQLHHRAGPADCH